MFSSRTTRVAIAIYPYQSFCSHFVACHDDHTRLGKDSISHDLPPAKKTIQKADDPSSVLHFSNSDRDLHTLAVSLALYTGGIALASALALFFYTSIPRHRNQKSEVSEGS